MTGGEWQGEQWCVCARKSRKASSTKRRSEKNAKKLVRRSSCGARLRRGSSCTRTPGTAHVSGQARLIDRASAWSSEEPQSFDVLLEQSGWIWIQYDQQKSGPLAQEQLGWNNRSVHG